MLSESNIIYYDLKLGLYDTCLAILYFGIVYLIAYYYKRIKIDKNPEYKYFIIGLTAKVVGGFTFALLTVYYYKGGDSLSYYKAADDITKLAAHNPFRVIELMFTSYSDLNLSQDFLDYYTKDFINGRDVWVLVKLTILTNIIGLFSYGTTTVLFAAISFVGLWMAYSNICKLYPKYSGYLLVSFFMIPSIIFWGSGVLKDTVTMGCMGWMIYAFSNIFIFKRKVALSIGLIIISSLLIIFLKPYILYILLPTLLIWGQTNLKNLIKGSFIRIILIPMIVLTISVSTFFVLQNISIGAGKYDINKLEQTLEGFQSWHEYLAGTQDQSGYTLGEIEFTPLGYLKIAPAAFNVTFFRPYIWEIRNVPTLIGALESFLILLFVLYLLLKYRAQFFRIMFKNKDILFMMIFAAIFGVIVGVSSYNFGALSRYKMPAQLLFVSALFLIYNIAKDEKRMLK
ncbi:MAG: hypothetical protein COA31_005505 [Flavobacteriales bacterium]|nr:hypothetical protein [Flavobacteriales bacterium]